MSFIELISNYLAKWLSTKVSNDKFPTVEDQIEVYTYGFMVIVGAVFKGFIMVSMASLFKVFIPAMVIMSTFSSLRIIAGGYHFDSYNKCITFSTLQFIGSALIVKHTLQYWSQINIISLIIFCILTALYMIIRYIPRDTESKRITDIISINKFKKWSLYYTVSWTLIMTIFLSFNLKLVILSSCFGLLLELFSISKLGNSAYSAIDNINFKTPKQ